MDWKPQDTLSCSCGRSFLQPGPLKFHQKSCTKSKKRIHGALEKAKDAWVQRKKQQRVDDLTEGQGRAGQPSNEVFKPISNTDKRIIQHRATPPTTLLAEHMAILVENDTKSLAERRVARKRQLPKRFQDVIPRPLPLLPPVPEIQSQTPPSPPSPLGRLSPTPSSSNQSLATRVLQTFRTPRNAFGLLRQYHSITLPSHDPEEHIQLQDLSDQNDNFQEAHKQASFHEPSTAAAATSAQPQEETKKKFHPFPNRSSFLLGNWYWTHGVQRSRESFRDLLDVVGSPAFSPSDVRHTPWGAINKILGRNDFDENDTDDDAREWMDEDAGWTRTPIHISVPFHSRTKKPGPQDYLVGHVYHRSLVSVIREKMANPCEDKQFHYEPYELFWKPSDTRPDVRIYGELYTSPEFMEAHRAIQEAPGEPGCNLPRVMVALMFWSDGTELTQFSNAKLWPSYLYFGNESKYRRCKPSSNLCNHVAYFEMLPDAFQDFASENMKGTRCSSTYMSHCRREVLHAQWEILLDADFVHAYEHGIVIECCDEITRRFYPRIVTYSADYKEKIVLATIRNRGYCPCPRCLIPLWRFRNMGMKRDRTQRQTIARVDDESRRHKVDTARDLIYKKNYAVNNPSVEMILKDQSLVATRNAFSKLAKFGFNLFLMLVVDLLHEFELGVWKALFIHLLRILGAVNKSLIDELDRRFRQIPTFGKDTIRRFCANVSEMKKLAARDFEDMLQCAIPVFEDLLPEPHNSNIMRLLFICAHWHGLAKLRLHTDDTLQILDDTTVQIGASFRVFSDKTCSAFDTRELDREVDARARRREKAEQGRPSSGASRKGSKADSSVAGAQRKKFNIDTYKYHSLGDYVNTIRRFGTADSYSSEPGELEHRTSKARYKCTNKKQFVRQLTRIERREARMRRIKLSLSRGSVEIVANTLQEHHHIGISQSQYVHIGTFLKKRSSDPATKDFLPKLRQHLLGRIIVDIDALGDQGDHLLNSVLFKHDRMYEHSIFRINYTTYDIRRSQDVVNPHTSHYNVMVLGNQDDDGDTKHPPFQYARVLGVYHVNVVYVGPGMVDYEPRRMEFLWVRWYQVLGTTGTGWDACKLDRLRFLSVAEQGAFGFIDPAVVLRSCHIIPSFARGKVHLDGRGLSRCAHDSSDWVAYHVNRFVDRDMLMRYHFGLGVGHRYAHRGGVGKFNHPPTQSQECGNAESEEEQDEGSIDVLEPEGSSSDDGEDDDDDSEDSQEPTDDEEFFAIQQMYGPADQ